MGLQSVDRQGRGAPCCCYCCTMDEEIRKETAMPGSENPEAEMSEVDIPNCSAIKAARVSSLK